MSKQIVKSRVNPLSDCKGVVLGKRSLKIVYKSNVKKIKYSSIIGFCTYDRSFKGHTLELTTNKEVIVVTGLSHLKAVPQFDSINRSIAKCIESGIQTRYSKFFNAAVGQYLRESKIPQVQSIIKPIVGMFHKNRLAWEKHISPEHYDLISELSEYVPLSETAESLRDKYVDDVLNRRKSFYDTIESNPLTAEQRRSVVQHDDYNMVLAAAGTGKTSVMVAKTADILVQKLAKPDEVMVLAYGKDAAEELKERAKERLKEAGIKLDLDDQISTFHSRGYQIIAEVEKTTVEDFKRLKMSPLRKNEAKKEFINNWLVRFIGASEKNLSAFINTVYYAYNPFLAESEEAHQDALKGKVYKTINGFTVKGYQEVLIGNWLFKNGINYEYEPNYGETEGVVLGFPYRPDFKIVDENIYIEHFGIDRAGNTRAGIDRDDYNEKIAQKFELHKNNGTRLVDTYHYHWCEGKLEQKLAKKLADVGIVPKPISNEEIIKTLKQQDFIDNAVAELMKTLASVRAEDIEGNKILERLREAKIGNAECHAYLIESLRHAYVTELADRQQIDYDDMILKAKRYISEGKYTPKWKYILVDEFQDISASRWNLLMEFLKADDCSLTVVGDDWQAIYAFTGGKIGYTTEFDKNVGNHALTKLQKTFRYNNSIADTAGNFIEKNPKQHTKRIVTHTQVSEPEVYLMDNQGEGNPVEATLNAVEQQIRKIHEETPDASIAILSRYNKTKKAAKAKFEKELGFKNMFFWSLHGSKGLEADYCFILDLNQGYFGFPTERKESEIVSALMPSNETFPHAEERRLFYVAITRSKKRCYLVADPKEPSEFVLELLNPDFKLNIISEYFTPEKLAARKCPNCESGYLKPKKGHWGIYECSTGLGCTNSLGQRTEAVACDVKSCGGLAVKKVTNAECLSCRTRFELCPNCKSPKIVRTNGTTQRLFVACSSFRGNEKKSCKFSDSLSPALQDVLNDKDRIPC
ncbi:helicase IV [Vibrio harveyi]|nr:helicase IV [Vibrio harveyi]